MFEPHKVAYRCAARLVRLDYVQEGSVSRRGPRIIVIGTSSCLGLPIKKSEKVPSEKVPGCYSYNVSRKVYVEGSLASVQTNECQIKTMERRDFRPWSLDIPCWILDIQSFQRLDLP